MSFKVWGHTQGGSQIRMNKQLLQVYVARKGSMKGFQILSQQHYENGLASIKNKK